MKHYQRSKLALAILIAMTSAHSAYAQEQASNQQEAKTEVIEVRGIRSSLAKAALIKRSADSVVDAITVEDLGKFSDDSVADSLSRVPGVQIERNDDGRDGARVSIRGLGSQFTTTTVNGREVFSAGAEGQRELRSFSYDTLPSEVFHEIVVRKTPTADHVGSGLAGQVDIRTMRPLDAAPLKDKNFYGTATATYQDHNLAGDGGKFSILVGGQNNDATLGWYVSALTGDIKTGTLGNEFEQPRSGETITIGDTTFENVRTPGASSIEDVFETQERDVIVGAIQFVPSENFSIVADINYSDYTRDIFRSRSSLRVLGSTGNADAVSPTFAAGGAEVFTDEFGNNTLTFADFSQVQSYGSGCSLSDCAPRLFQVPLVFDHDTETTMGGVKADWQITNKLSVEADVYFSKVEFAQDLAVAEAFTQIPDFAFDTRGGGAAIYDLGVTTEQVVNDPNRQLPLAVFGRTFGLEVDNVGYALDFDYELDGQVLTSVEFGVRYNEADFERSETIGLNLGGELTADEQQAVLNTIYTQAGTDTGYGFSLLNHDEGALRAALASGLADATAAVAVAGQPADTFNNLGSRVPTPGAAIDSSEETLALYAEINGEFEVSDMASSFNLGVRGVKTDYSATGPALVNGGQGTLSGDSGWEVLPSFNLNTEINEDVVLRIGLGRSVSVPEVEELFRPTVVTPRSASASPTDPLAATSGNPNLEPTSAWTFDTTLEWYTPNDGTVIFSYFFKDIEDFIRDDTFVSTLPAPANDPISGEGTPVTVVVSGPVNFSDGEVSGFEVGFNQPLTIFSDALDGFGLQTNYTRVNSSFERNVGDAGLGFPGASEDNFNAIFYYEKGKFGARIAYTYRSDFLASLNAATQTSTVEEAQFAEGWDQVNFSANYDITDNVSVRFTATDIFESERRDFVGNKNVYRAFYQRGRTVAASVTAKF